MFKDFAKSAKTLARGLIVVTLVRSRATIPATESGVRGKVRIALLLGGFEGAFATSVMTSLDREGEPAMNMGANGEASEPELGLFIVWPHGRSFDQLIISAVASEFDVVAVREVIWSADLAAVNYSRFYRGRTLPPYRTSLVDAKGVGPFLTIIFRDGSPCYEERETPAGRLMVNARVHDLKTALRDETSAGFGIHASDSARTARRELVLLFGSAVAHLHDVTASDLTPEEFPHDPIAATGWRDRDELYTALGAATDYIDLSLPHESSLRLLTREPKEVLSILGATAASTYHHRSCGSYSVRIGGEGVPVDLRAAPDHFIDPRWAAALIDGAALDDRGVRSPLASDALAFHLYDRIAHRRGIDRSDLTDLRAAFSVGDALCLESPRHAEAWLTAMMDANGYHVTVPDDRCVRIDHRAAKTPHPVRRSILDMFVRWIHLIVGPRVVGPTRFMILSSRERLLVRVPTLRRIEDRLRQRHPVKSP